MLQPDDAGFFRLTQQQLLIYLFCIHYINAGCVLFYGVFQSGKRTFKGPDATNQHQGANGDGG